MGYNVNRFIDADVDANLVCNICAGVMEKAVVTICGHSFCQMCLSVWLDRPETDSCPICRSSISQKDLIPNLVLRSMIRTLMVWCDNKINGCKIVVDLENLPRHLQKCNFIEVSCAACDCKTNKADLPAHYRACAVMKEAMTKSRNGCAEQETMEILRCQYVAMELELKRTKDNLEAAKRNADAIEREFSQLKVDIENRDVIDSVRGGTTDWDPDYNYGYSPGSISKLSCLMARHLLEKPSFLDRNRIFMAIKRCYMYYHNYAGYSQDVHMLLATSYASNWFPEHQRWTLERWLEHVAQVKFPNRSSDMLSLEYR